MIAYFREDVDEEKEPVLKYLIEEAGVHVNAHGGFFGSALNLAVLCSSVERIKFIFDKVEDKNFADDFGRRPIHYAAMRSVEHVQFIMDVGGDLRLENKTGQTALHLSVGTGRVDLVEFILSRTKDLINEPDKDGWTPLHWAVRPSHTWGMPADTDVDIIKLLLSHGADVSAIGQSYDQLWAPIKLATYFRASDEILALLKPNPTKGVAEEARDQRFYTSHRVVEDESYYCDGCLWVSSVHAIITTPRTNCAGSIRHVSQLRRVRRKVLPLFQMLAPKGRISPATQGMGAEWARRRNDGRAGSAGSYWRRGRPGPSCGAGQG
jgi:ankyrin repeat protein